MRKVWHIARHEYLTNLRRPAFLFFTFIFPAVGALLFLISSFFSGAASDLFRTQFEPRQQPLGIVDPARQVTPVPAVFAERFTAFENDAAAMRALLADEISAYVVVPADYLQTGRLTSYARAGFSGMVATDSQDLQEYLVDALLRGKVDAQLVARASTPPEITPVTVDAQGKPTAGGALSFVAGFLGPYLLSLMFIMSIFISSNYLLRSVNEEKESRVIEIVLSSVSTSELLSGKVIGLGALGLTQVGVWLLSAFALSATSGAVILGAVLLLNFNVMLLGLIYFTLGYLIYAMLMATAGALGTNLRESQQIASLFSFFAAIPYILSGLLFLNPNATIARALSFFPLTAPTMMMLRLALAPLPSEDIVGSIALLLISIPLIWWMGAKLFRAGVLMYGKLPTLGEVARALRSN